MSLMRTQNFKYADELLDFLADLLWKNAGQFQVAYHNQTKEYAVSYPPGILPFEDEEEEEEAEEEENE